MSWQWWVYFVSVFIAFHVLLACYALKYDDAFDSRDNIVFGAFFSAMFAFIWPLLCLAGVSYLYLKWFGRLIGNLRKDK
jgi:hypothetical protein